MQLFYINVLQLSQPRGTARVQDIVYLLQSVQPEAAAIPEILKGEVGGSWYDSFHLWTSSFPFSVQALGAISLATENLAQHIEERERKFPVQTVAWRCQSGLKRLWSCLRPSSHHMRPTLSCKKGCLALAIHMTFEMRMDSPRFAYREPRCLRER